jgi:hypothetical protein
VHHSGGRSPSGHGDGVHSAGEADGRGAGARGLAICVATPGTYSLEASSF